MHIDDELLAKLERLSMLHIDEDKREKTKEQLSQIVEFVENISHIDVQTDCFEEPFSTPLREDEPQISDVAQDVLKNAPYSQSQFFVVPKIIE